MSVGRREGGFIFPVKCLCCFCTSKIKLFLRITNSGQPTNKQAPCKTSRRRIPSRAVPPGSPSPSLPLPAGFTLPDGIFSLFPLLWALPSGFQGGMTWAVRGGGDSELLRSSVGAIQRAGSGQRAAGKSACAGEAHRRCSPGMLTGEGHCGAALEAGRKGSGILHPPRGTGEGAEGMRVPAGAGRGAEGDTRLTGWSRSTASLKNKWLQASPEQVF